ncbi:hypothetical protein [Streptomyces sp. MP131-18]|uniref:hypothetical protein n=1 Tax=Streptomyces sp. MP131-18 TaxID=1857892 RepID=UPI00097CAE43|nr:hypothetical protein [Streptomyces sp. MP131-18]ONK14461.1 hypothetical protein STBA_52460 [Streptomyces sp. MP131-18]
MTADSDSTRWRFRPVALGAALLLAAATACSGSDEPPWGAGSPDGALLSALEKVPYADAPPEGLAWVDIERAEELLAADEQRFTFVQDFGTPLFNDLTVPEHRYGLDPAAAHTAVTVGFQDQWGFWAGDFDAAAVAEDLAADGFREEPSGEAPVWTGPEGQPVLQVTDEEITWGREGFDPAGSASGTPLAEAPGYQELSRCLGNEVYRVDVIQRDPDSAVLVWAVGLLAESPEDTSSVLCSISADQDAADRVADSLRTVLDEDDEAYADSEVERVDGDRPGVRVHIPDDATEHRPGRLLTHHMDLMLAMSDL